MLHIQNLKLSINYGDMNTLARLEAKRMDRLRSQHEAQQNPSPLRATSSLAPNHDEFVKRIIKGYSDRDSFYALSNVHAYELRFLADNKPFMLEPIMRLSHRLNVHFGGYYSVIVTSINHDLADSKRSGSHQNYHAVDFTIATKNGIVKQSPPFNRNLILLVWLARWYRSFSPSARKLSIAVEADHIHEDDIHQPGLWIYTHSRGESGKSNVGKHFWRDLDNEDSIVNVFEIVRVLKRKKKAMTLNK